MRFFLLLLPIFLGSSLGFAQNPADTHKIVLHYSEGDPATHPKLLRNLENILAAAPDTELVLVTIGMGVDLMRRDIPQPLQEKMQALQGRGVRFEVCENTLKQRGLEKAEFLPISSYVTAGILALVELQKAGFIYIKAG
ncbi:MAG: DsrE family protein [Nitritalea sp.]